jgi:hypothetical protein
MLPALLCKRPWSRWNKKRGSYMRRGLSGLSAYDGNEFKFVLNANTDQNVMD